MGIENIEIYVLVCETNEGVVIDLHYSKQGLCRMLRSKMFKNDWEQCVISKILKDIDLGKTITMNWLVADRRLYLKKATTRYGIKNLKESIIENFIEEYYSNNFTNR